MKKTTILKMLLVAVGLSTGVSAWGDCAVTTDSYGKTQIVWDFGIAAQTGGATYYLNASSNAYEAASTTYGTARKYYTTAMIVVHANRAIYSSSNPDSDKGAGVVLGKDQGYIEIYAPVSGTLSITGKYLSNATIEDKITNTKVVGTNSLSVNAGDRVQIYANNGTGVATMTLTPTGYETDNVESGTNDFSALEYFLADAVIPKGTYVFTSNGYKSISGKEDVKDALVIYTVENGGTADDATIDISSENYRGVKIGGNSKNDYNYTTSMPGTLTITYNYGGNRGSRYIKNSGTGSVTTYEDKTLVTSLSAGQRLQVVTGTSGIYIKSVSFAATPVTGTIASSGWSSLASAYALDFSSATNAAGYVVSSITNSTVTLESVNQIPAESGVLLKGDASEAYSIPVIASASAPATNYLKAAVTATDIAAEDAYILQGGKFHLVTAASTVPAGKAYLLASDVPSGSSRSLSFAFGDEEFTTGINNANANSLLDGEFYNLQGQRVDNPTKGLYIINGKKVIIK